jgi:hypothetical protein
MLLVVVLAVAVVYQPRLHLPRPLAVLFPTNSNLVEWAGCTCLRVTLPKLKPVSAD